MAARPRGGRGAARTTRPQEIMRVAETLFARRGFHATSMDDVAEAVGLTKPAIYHYFPSKDDILLEIRQRNIDAMHERIGGVLEADGSPAVKLRDILVVHTERVLRQRNTNKIYYEEQGAVTGVRARAIRDAENAYEEVLRRLYADGVRAGELRDVDPGIAVATILGACNWSYRWFRPRGQLAVGEMAELIVSLQLEGHLVR